MKLTQKGVRLHGTKITDYFQTKLPSVTMAPRTGDVSGYQGDSSGLEEERRFLGEYPQIKPQPQPKLDHHPKVKRKNGLNVQ